MMTATSTSAPTSSTTSVCLIKNILFSLAGFKGNLSLLDIFQFFQGA